MFLQRADKGVHMAKGSLAKPMTGFEWFVLVLIVRSGLETGPGLQGRLIAHKRTESCVARSLLNLQR